LGKADEAIAHFQKAVDIKPNFGDAQNNLGIALLQTGKAEQAVPHFLMALEIDPTQAQTYYSLGGALFVQGKVKEALARWREGLRTDPNNLPLLNQTAWVLATFPEATFRNGREAVELGERAVKASPTPDPVLLDTLAAAYAEASRFPEAVRTARQALDLATQQNAQPLVQGLKTRIAAYESHFPFRDRQ
jgi:tetratricopeptide (TPR) repeat protein